jgi:hypothetical protein
MKEPPSFETTQWTLLEREREAGRAEQWVCENYRGPVLAWFRQRYGHHEAEDLCHEFLEKQVLAGKLVTRAERGRGSLRALLRVGLVRFAIKHGRRVNSQRHGGRVKHVPVEAQAERLSDTEGEAPDVLFDRIWAAEMLERALAVTEAYYAGRSRQHWFDALRPLLEGSDPAHSRAAVATALGLSARELTMALYRLRERIGTNLYREVVHTVRGAASAHEEWAALRELLRW